MNINYTSSTQTVQSFEDAEKCQYILGITTGGKAAFLDFNKAIKKRFLGNDPDDFAQSTSMRESLQSLYGTQYTQGTQGIQGLQGIQGIQGTQAIGPQGTQGLQGVAGEQGEIGPEGLQGCQAISSYDPITGIIWKEVRGEHLDITSSTTVRGPQGTQGITPASYDFYGAQGIQGLRGLQGPQGPDTVGPQGYMGSIWYSDNQDPDRNANVQLAINYILWNFLGRPTNWNWRTTNKPKSVIIEGYPVTTVQGCYTSKFFKGTQFTSQYTSQYTQSPT